MGSPSSGASGALYGQVCGLTGCQCLYSRFYRSRMRPPGDPLQGFLRSLLVRVACPLPDAQGVPSRGYDMKIGWHANMERQNAGAAAVPVPSAPYQAMMR